MALPFVRSEDYDAERLRGRFIAAWAILGG